ncbi:uncharacterized protein LOC128671567 [Plodia interpunctella]|uniref:uncharacterized protein LOC128671567 n=1 Tax=Plodia interpunctella TaxID=58824 RepID=UPI00236837C1|nr:uncharacterized protein LOC128671567 [Plodia interpunctella]
MKRKLCAVPSFNCDDDMEELNVAALSRRKESAAPLTGERDVTIFRHALNYPLALVLRLRVLQIVCGISAMVMGSVAFIEERQKFNMGLGIPAGGFSVLAAAVSIHTSRGWSAVTGGAGAGAGAAGVLWAAAACLLLALIVQCCRTILDPPGMNHGDGPTEDDSVTSPRDLVVIACIQITLAAATLFSAAVCARIDCNT